VMAILQVKTLVMWTLHQMMNVVFALRKMRLKVPPKTIKNYYQRERKAVESIASRNIQKALKFETYREGIKRAQWNTHQDSQSCGKSMDVVSFTFVSPMMSSGGSQTTTHLMKKKQGQTLDDWRES